MSQFLTVGNIQAMVATKSVPLTYFSAIPRTKSAGAPATIGDMKAIGIGAIDGVIKYWAYYVDRHRHSADNYIEVYSDLVGSLINSYDTKLKAGCEVYSDGSYIRISYTLATPMAKELPLNLSSVAQAQVIFVLEDINVDKHDSFRRHTKAQWYSMELPSTIKAGTQFYTYSFHNGDIDVGYNTASVEYISKEDFNKLAATIESIKNKVRMDHIEEEEISW